MEITKETIIFAIIALAFLIVTVVFSVILIFTKKEKRKEMKKSKITACISAVLTPCMLFAAIVSMHTICPPPPMQMITTLPDITGFQYDACKEAYSDHFDLAVEEELYSSEYPEGVIIEQKPAYGSEYLISRTTVYCKISKGPRMVMVSNVIGLAFEDANYILGEKNDGFRVGFVSEYSDDVPTGTVIATDPPAGEKVAYGSAVKVTVSGGKEPDVTASTEWYKELN